MHSEWPKLHCSGCFECSRVKMSLYLGLLWYIKLYMYVIVDCNARSLPDKIDVIQQSLISIMVKIALGC